MKIRILLVFTWLAITLGGCTAFQLHDANQALTNHYFAKQKAAENGDWRMVEDARSALASLAADAAAQAENESDVGNQIAFYRVATTAAWQSDDTHVLRYADSGQSLCNGGQFDKAPRDCAMLAVIPPFAAVDQTTKKLDALTKQVQAASDRAKFSKQAEALFEDYRDSLSLVLRGRRRITESDVNPDFVGALDRNTGQLLCQLLEINAVGLVAMARGDVVAARCAVFSAKLLAVGAGLNAACLPASHATADVGKPPGC